MKIAVVIHRYGNVIGGAEKLCFELCKRLAKIHTVHVYTTTSESYHTWKGNFEAGSSVEESGVIVHRFKPKSYRIKFLFRLIHFALSHVKRLPEVPQLLGGKEASTAVYASVNEERSDAANTANEALQTASKGSYSIYSDPGYQDDTHHDFFEKLWLKLQGPYVPDLINELKKKQDEYDFILFNTYLYFPTVVGVEEITRRPKFLIPSAHDEPAMHRQIIKKMFLNVDKIFYNTEAEKEIILKHVPYLNPSKFKFVGCGVEAISCNSPRIIDKDYVLYMGRIHSGKNIEELIRFYKSLKTDIILVLAGSLEMQVKESESIRVLKNVSEEVKANLIYYAKAIVHPSHHESLSILCLEAMASEKPLLLNKNCAVFYGYAKEFKSVFLYSDLFSFKNEFYKTIQCNDIQVLETTRDQILSRYGWNAVLNRFLKD